MFLSSSMHILTFDFEDTYVLKFKYAYTSSTKDFTYKNDGTDAKFYAGDKVTWTAYLENTEEGKPSKGATYELDASKDLYFKNTPNAPASEVTLKAAKNMSISATLEIKAGEDWIEDVDVKFTAEKASVGSVDYNDFTYTVTTYLDEDDETTLSNMLGASTNVKVVNNTVDAEDTTYIPRLIITYGKGDGTPHPVTLASVSVAE